MNKVRVFGSRIENEGAGKFGLRLNAIWYENTASAINTNRGGVHYSGMDLTSARRLTSSLKVERCGVKVVEEERRGVEIMC